MAKNEIPKRPQYSRRWIHQMIHEIVDEIPDYIGVDVPEAQAEHANELFLWVEGFTALLTEVQRVDAICLSLVHLVLAARISFSACLLDRDSFLAAASATWDALKRQQDMNDKIAQEMEEESN